MCTTYISGGAVLENSVDFHRILETQLVKNNGNYK